MGAKAPTFSRSFRSLWSLRSSWSLRSWLVMTQMFPISQITVIIQMERINRIKLIIPRGGNSDPSDQITLITPRGDFSWRGYLRFQLGGYPRFPLADISDLVCQIQLGDDGGISLFSAFGFQPSDSRISALSLQIWAFTGRAHGHQPWDFGRECGLGITALALGSQPSAKLTKT